MPEDGSSSWMISEENFPVMAFERGKIPLKRRWICPSDEAIAAYVDCTLAEKHKTRLQNHLANCERCRSMVADIIKLQRDIELPAPPLAAAKKVLVVAPKMPTRLGLVWAPAAGMALVLLVVTIVLLHREPQKLALSLPPVPTAPIIANVDRMNPENSTAGEITRQPVIPNIAPVILSPLPDSTVGPDQLQFAWKPVERSRYYEISLVTSDGDLLWRGKTQASSLHLPRRVVLERGSYFLWVSAYLIDGQIAKSSPIKFLVDR